MHKISDNGYISTVVEHGGHVAERQDFRLSGLGFETTFCRFETWTISFFNFAHGRDIKSPWFVLSGVFSRGSIISHAGKWKKSGGDSVTLEKDALK